jgi:molybdopterin-dependent oxidoreductase alpha subunit
MTKRFHPELWVSKVPFGIGQRRPNNYLEITRAIGENRDNLAYAWRILRHGVCDGCALGTSGLRDWTTDEVHLCNVRLRLLRLNTMPALDAGALDDVAALRREPSRDLRDRGRLPFPMVRRHGEAGFTRVSWDTALDLVGGRIAATTPDRIAAYLTSRGIPNETYYAAQKAMRALGTNAVDNAARVCHSPSTVALKDTLGVAATTCSYVDWLETDLIVFIGSNVANNQPVAMKYLYKARRNGTQVVAVNTYREPGMERYWVPSNLESAVFGTRMTDRFFLVNVGGDAAFLTGVVKSMVERGAVDDAFVAAHTTGFDALHEWADGRSWAELERLSGTTRREMDDMAAMVGAARRAVFVWSMGVTQHVCGEDTVRAIVNLALTKGFVGRDGCGIMPIRGHSGVQGGAEMGCYSTALPGGRPIDDAGVATLSAQWGFDVPAAPGLTAPAMLDAAADGRLDVLLSAGGNFLEVLPEPAWVEQALGRIPTRVHLDIVLSSQMLVDPPPDGVVVVLPAATRYEIPGGVTETSTERRVIFSPEIPGPRIAEARPEWEVFAELVRRARPDRAAAVAWPTTAAIRDEIADVIPFYDGIQHLRAEGDQFQYGGRHLCAGWRFATTDGRARFSVVSLPDTAPPPGRFRVSTRRGKQFNSMVHADRDPITGHGRDAVLVHAADAAELGLSEGDRVALRSDVGSLEGRVAIADVQRRTLEVHWPEGLVLIDRRHRSPAADIPDYNAVVSLERLGAAS